MASTVYFGKSTTGSGVSTKIVTLNGTLNPSDLKDGDILYVYFNNTNTQGQIALELQINDSNQGLTTNSRNVYNTGVINIADGAWAPNEVVCFAYVKNNNTNEARWEMVAKNRASTTVYGNVLLNGSDESNSAISVTNAKNLIASSVASNLVYRDDYLQGSLIGQLTYTPPAGSSIEPTAINIHVPSYPTSLEQFTNNKYITNILGGENAPDKSNLIFSGNTKQIWVNDGIDNQCIIDLKTDDTGALKLTALENILLQPANGKDVVIGTNSNNTDLIVNGSIAVTGDADIGGTTTISDLVATNATITNLQILGSNLGDADMESLSIGGIDLSDYIDNRIHIKYLDEAYRIFGSDSQHITWMSRSVQGTIASGKTTYVEIGDFGKVGYRTVGIVSWNIDSVTHGYCARVLGFKWTNSPTTNKNDVLHIKIYNDDSAAITVTASAIVWMVKDNSNLPVPSIPEAEVQGTEGNGE